MTEITALTETLFKNFRLALSGSAIHKMAVENLALINVAEKDNPKIHHVVRCARSCLHALNSNAMKIRAQYSKGDLFNKKLG